MGTNYIVRYGTTRNVAEFTTKSESVFSRCEPVIVRTDRGTEWGEVLCPADENTKQYLGGQDPNGRILRKATPDDHGKRDETDQKEWDEFEGCREMIRERSLQMQLVDVEHLFGGERIIFYYLAEKRVDFRELVKALAKRYQARIEMRQIGVRDEAKLLADFGDCGKSVCCNTHLRAMPPVSMKMAKLQKATLDPSKISGRCGRLKCCLRYESQTYEEHRRELPPLGSTILTRQGRAKVLAHELLARNLLVAFDGDRKALISHTEVLTDSEEGNGE